MKIIIYIILFIGIILLIITARKLRRIHKELKEQLKVLNKQKERWLKKVEETEEFFEQLDKKIKEKEEKIKEMKRRKKRFEQGVCDDIVDEEIKPYNAFDAAGIPRDTKTDCTLILATTEDGIVFFTRADLIVYPGQKLEKYMDREL